MAGTAILQVLLDVSDLLSGSKVLRHEFTNEVAASQTTQVTLLNGFNSIAVPATALGVVVVFDPTSTVTKTLKGVTGDTGIVVTDCIVLVFKSGSVPSTIGITTSGADTGKYTEIAFF